LNVEVPANRVQITARTRKSRCKALCTILLKNKPRASHTALTPDAVLRAEVRVEREKVWLEDGVIPCCSSQSYVGSV